MGKRIWNQKKERLHFTAAAFFAEVLVFIWFLDFRSDKVIGSMPHLRQPYIRQG